MPTEETAFTATADDLAQAILDEHERVLFDEELEDIT
jgi:hypothetical protein